MVKNTHNIEGFRKADTDESFFEKNDINFQGGFKIICLGGSTTYCTDIEKNEYTWPFKVNEV